MKKSLATMIVVFLVCAIINSALAWQIERPWSCSPGRYLLPPRAGSSTTDNVASVGLGVHAVDYHENLFPYSSDVIGLNVTMTANSRMHITYNYTEELLYWIDPDPNIDTILPNLGDNLGFMVDLIPPDVGYEYAFRFYGGVGSAEYQQVWMCTNGFIAFDQSHSTRPNPTTIPSQNAPNSIIAVVWSDLNVDSQASIAYGWRQNYGYSGWQFVITWNNVLHKASGGRLTFQIVLANAPGYWNMPYITWGQSRFRLSYKDVIGVNTNFAFGIEDQEGRRGLGNLLPGWQLAYFNGHSYMFRQRDYSSNYFINKLTLTFSDTCSSKTRFEISDEGEYLRGFNVKLKEPSTPDLDLIYKLSLWGTETLLSLKGGVMLESFFAGVDLVDILAYNFRNRTDYMELRDQFHNQIPSGAYFVAPTPCTNELWRGCVVDACIGISVRWILDDEHNMEHSLTVTAKLDYYEVDYNGNVIDIPHTIATSANLKVTPDSSDKQNNNSFENATQIQEGTYSWLYADNPYDPFDFYKVYVPDLKSIRVNLEGIDNSDDFNLYLYNSTGHLIDKSENGPGQNETVYGEQWKYPGEYWYIEVNATVGFGFYNMTVSLGVAGGGEPCPTLLVWNGNGYVDYGVINIHNPSGEDVVREVPVSKEDVAIANYQAYFRLREGWSGLNFSESVIDQVKLYAVVDGNRYLCPLITATHSRLGNVLLQLLLSDNRETQILLLETIDLKFFVPYQNIQSYIFKIEGCNMLKE